MYTKILFHSLTDVDNLTNVVNDILINEINQHDGVFKDVDIDTDGNILVGEKCSDTI